MCSEPHWLPDKAKVDPWQNSEQHDTYEMLYGIFQKDIVSTKLRYDGNEVWYFRGRNDFEDGKEKLFWHLTSRMPKPFSRRKRKYANRINQDVERVPDLCRSERLPWIRPMIENPDSPYILAWDYEEGDQKINTYVWLKDHDFVVIMKKYPDGRRRLITSYCVDHPSVIKTFERKYASRKQ